MENNIENFNNGAYNSFKNNTSFVLSADTTSKFFRSVFTFMGIGLLITAMIAYYFATSGLLVQYFFNNEGKANMLYWVVLLAPIGFVWLISSGLNKYSSNTMRILFLAYSAINGVTFGSIFLAFDMGVIFKAFMSAGVLFGVFAIAGYTTKTDLSKLGKILFMALIAFVIMSIINIFIGSSTFDYVMSFIGIAIFTGLTAYDMQKLKTYAQIGDANSEESKKYQVMGALTLYLDFINIFLFLLRIFGRND